MGKRLKSSTKRSMYSFEDCRHDENLLFASIYFLLVIVNQFLLLSSSCNCHTFSTISFMSLRLISWDRLSAWSIACRFTNIFVMDLMFILKDWKQKQMKMLSNQTKCSQIKQITWKYSILQENVFRIRPVLFLTLIQPLHLWTLESSQPF